MILNTLRYLELMLLVAILIISVLLLSQATIYGHYLAILINASNLVIGSHLIADLYEETKGDILCG